MGNNVEIIEDTILKDDAGNGVFLMERKQKKLIGAINRFSVYIYRKENEDISGCRFVKSSNDGYKKNIFELHFDNKNSSNNKMTYYVKNMAVEHTYNILENDVMLSVKITNAKEQNEQNSILQEFDKLMWLSAKMGESKATIVDVITDVLDTTEVNNTDINGNIVTDICLIHTAIKGFFAEIDSNVEKVEFKEE